MCCYVFTGRIKVLLFGTIGILIALFVGGHKTQNINGTDRTVPKLYIGILITGGDYSDD